MASPAADPDTGVRIREIAVELLPTSADLGKRTAAHIAAYLPEFGSGEPGALVVATCQANANSIIDGLARNVAIPAVAPTVEVRQLTRELARHGLQLPAVMRAYRIGAQFWTEHWAAAVRRRVRAGDDAVAIAQAGTSFMFGWLDQISERVAEEYREEAERIGRERSLAHLDDVRRALADPDLDQAATSARLGYHLHGRHLALVLRHEPSGTNPDADARRFAEAITPARPLIVRIDVRTTWCWVSYPGDERPKVPAPPAALTAAAGRPRFGLAGFRESHREALAALRVADLARRGPGTLTYYDDVAVAVICSADPDRCRAFVRAQLGGLTGDDAATRRLRATLAEFFAANSNYRATAARLGIHHNTVRYRLQRAQQILGHPLGERRLALELALHLAASLGSPMVDDEQP